jgi:glycosyltransferase involved in cell wall biosynthesis
MMLSPSIYSVFKKNGIPVVQTLHNYRLLCPNALFFRDNNVCEDCLKFLVPLPGIIHKCYRESMSQTAAVATMLSYHRFIGTWQKQIDFYITLSEFARTKFIQGGLPPEKLTVKPNFLPDFSFQSDALRNHVLYAGRLSPEKGIQILDRAWREISPSNIPLYVAGDGPEKEILLQLSSEKDNVRYLGKLDRVSLDRFIAQSRFVIIPSVCYENFPMSILDAFRLGVPVVASQLGSIMELVRNSETGLLFNPGDPADLAAKVNWLWNHPDEAERMGKNARREYEQKYTPDKNYQMLIEIYEKAITESAR